MFNVPFVRSLSRVLCRKIQGQVPGSVCSHPWTSARFKVAGCTVNTRNVHFTVIIYLSLTMSLSSLPFQCITMRTRQITTHLSRSASATVTAVLVGSLVGLLSCCTQAYSSVWPRVKVTHLLGMEYHHLSRLPTVNALRSSPLGRSLVSELKATQSDDYLTLRQGIPQFPTALNNTFNSHPLPRHIG